MPVNPFIELLRDPVGALAWVGYLLIMLSILTGVGATAVVAVPWSIRQVAKLINHYYRDRRSDDWWSFGDNPVGYIPPVSWLAGALKVCTVYIGLTFLAAVASWALGTVFWMVG